MLASILLLCGSALAIGRRDTPTGTGTDNGYFYSYYNEVGGNITYNNGADGEYSVVWSNVTDFVAGKGWMPGAARDIEWTGTFETPGNAYLSVYGWTTNPLVEYYILENYGDYNPGSQLTYKGNVSSDDSIYDIYEGLRTDAPSINGTQTFNQYWSIRRDLRSSGTVTTANHFDAWANLGLVLGDFNYQILATEGYESSGSSDITILTPADDEEC